LRSFASIGSILVGENRLSVFHHRFRAGGRQLFPNPGDSGIWSDSDAIIDRRPNPLLAAKVSLGCLNRDMSQQELDLLQFAS
jgi:hypothetical protein